MSASVSPRVKLSPRSRFRERLSEGRPSGCSSARESESLVGWIVRCGIEYTQGEETRKMAAWVGSRWREHAMPVPVPWHIIEKHHQDHEKDVVHQWSTSLSMRAGLCCC